MVALMEHQQQAQPDEEENWVATVPASVRALWRFPMYSEARTWFQWMNVFVPSDIADSMGIDDAVATRLCEAGAWQRIIKFTGDFDNGEGIYEYVPLPGGPRNHPVHVQPERMVGYTEVLGARNGPIRIRTERDQRKSMSTPGARGHINRREQRYKAMQEAVEKRRALQQAKAKEEPEWKRKAGGSAAKKMIDTRQM
jgi:hypothetical protein